MPQGPVALGRLRGYLDPSNLALSDDGQYLYVGLATPRSVLRIRLATREVETELRLDDATDPALGEIADLAVMPGRPGTIAVLLKPAGGVN